MSPSKFNFPIYASKLESAGVPKEQASIHALALADVLETQTVTKGDLEAQEERVNAQFEHFEKKFMAELAAMEKRVMGEIAALRNDITAFRDDVIKWVAILSVSQIGVTSTIVALIVHAR